MSEYVTLADIDVKSDCNFTADDILKLPTNTVVEKLYTLGPWTRVKYGDTEGWIYPFDKSNNFLLEDNDTSPIKTGDAVYIKSNKETVLDTTGKIAHVKRYNSKIFYIVTEMKDNPKVAKIEDNHGNYYWVKQKDIDKVNTSIVNKSRRAPVDDRKENNFLLASLFSFDSFFGSSSSSSSAGIAGSQNMSAAQYIQSAATKWYHAGNSTDDDRGISWTTAKDRVAALQLDNLRTIFGMPYQYMPIADMRLNSANPNLNGAVDHRSQIIRSLGVKYSEKIVARMPLLIMVPGVADFMAGFDAKDREKMLREMIGDMRGVTTESTFINDFAKTMKGTRASFYNMYPAWPEYYEYVNPMCWAAAKFMGIGDIEIINGIPLSRMRWEDERLKPKAFSEIVSYKGACGFYIQSDNQMSEQISTSTTQSAIANKINSLADQGREMIFLSSSVDGMLEKAGEAAQSIGKSMTSVGQDASGRASDMVAGTEFIKKFEASGGAINAIMNGVSNTIAGSKMLFPDLWQDSEFSRDYSFTLKLDSPDNDPLSLYLNIVVPLIHIICFAAPRNMGPTVYASPFLVRAYYQGFFNVNMGIITSVAINKGNEGAWTLKNIPTVVEIQVTIRDLFNNNLTISKSQNTDLNFITNTPLLDYVANLCGININEPEMAKVLTLYGMLANGYARGYLTDKWNRIVNWLAAGKQNLYNSILSGNFNPTRLRY